MYLMTPELLFFMTTASFVHCTSDRVGPPLIVKGGIIYNDQHLNCTININGTTIYLNGTEKTGYHFGLIMYNCDNETGSMLSRSECFECGMYCPQNDKLKGCQHVWVPLLIGLTIGVVLAVLVFKCVLTCKRHFFDRMLDNVSDYRLRRRAKKVKKMTEMVNTMIESNSATALATAAVSTRILSPEELTEHNNKMVQENLDKAIASGSTQADAEQSATKPVKNNSGNRSPYAMVKNALFATAALDLATKSYACDQTLYLRSSGQICDTYKCQDINSYTFLLQMGSVICFNTPLGEKYEFSVKETRMVTMYRSLYQISDYNVKTKDTWSCRGSEMCTERCKKGSVHPDLNVTHAKIQYYDCMGDTTECDSYCWHKSACTWWTWWIESVGAKAQVMSAVDSIWSFKLNIVRNGTIRIIEFNANNPVNIADLGALYGSNDLPVTVSNVMHSTAMVPKKVVMDGDDYYFHDASEINFPGVGMVGDYQISLKNSSETFAYKNVECRPANCKVTCDYGTPALRMLRQTKQPDRYITIEKQSSTQIKAHQPIFMSVYLTIGNVNFKNLFVESARCEVNVDSTYGCSACDQYPYAVVSTANIKSKGLMLFTSNCSFTRDYFSCDDQLQVLNPKEKYDTCKIWIRNTNSTMYINFSYDFVGNLNPSRSSISTNTGSMAIMSSIISNPNLIDGIIYSFTLMSTITFIIGIASKILNRLMYYRQLRRVEEKV